MEQTITALNWRYATKKFDTSKKLTDEQLSMLEETLRLSPSSYGLQPWKFIVVSDPEVRAKLRAAGYNQPQITDASQLVVFAVPKVVDDALVDVFIQSVADAKGMPVDGLKGYADMIKGSLAGKSPEARVEWAARQVYIALGFLLAAAAGAGIDACPMEGFDPKKFDEILGLGALGLESKVVAAIGFRSSDDENAGMPKFRFPKEKVIITK